MKIDRDEFTEILKKKIESSNKALDEEINNFVSKPSRPSPSAQENLLNALISEAVYDKMHEADINDPSLSRKIERMARLSDQIDKIKEELGRTEREYREIENELRPLIEELSNAQEKALKTRNYIVTIKRQGYRRTNYKYKSAFDYLYERVNGSMKKIVDEALEANKSFSDILSALGVQKRVDELLKEFAPKIGKLIQGYTELIRKENEEIDKYLQEMKKLIPTEGE